MTEDISVIEKIVSGLNEEIYEQTIDDGLGLKPFQFETNGEEQGITFLNMGIWDSESDERSYVERPDGKDPMPNEELPIEDLEQFVRREAMKFIAALTKVHL